MKRKILSAFLFLALFLELMIPAVGTWHEEKISKTIPLDMISSFGIDSLQSNGALTDSILSKIAGTAPGYALEKVDFSAIFASQRDVESVSFTSIDLIMPIEKNVRVPSVASVQNLRSAAFAGSESELITALANPSIDVIIITASFSLTVSHAINHTLTFIPMGGTYAITAASGKVHFTINNQTTAISVTFSNIVLDGNDLGGGITIENSYVSINGAKIQNCADNGTCSGAAISAHNIVRDSNTNEFHVSGSLTINGGSFTDNQTDEGAIECLGPISIYGATIADNIGSGVLALNISEEGATAYFESVTVENNTADSMGGGLNLIGYTVVITGQPT